MRRPICLHHPNGFHHSIFYILQYDTLIYNSYLLHKLRNAYHCLCNYSCTESDFIHVWHSINSYCFLESEYVCHTLNDMLPVMNNAFLPIVQLGSWIANEPVIYPWKLWFGFIVTVEHTEKNQNTIRFLRINMLPSTHLCLDKLAAFCRRHLNAFS